MKRYSTMFKVALGVAGLAAHASSFAINGTELGGHGVQNASMGGASIALPLDAIAPANNPAGIVALPDSAVIDLQVFRGNSSAQYVMPGNILHNDQTIGVPEFGVVRHLSPSLAWDIALASSGSGSDYGQPALPVPGAANAKSSLRIVELLPTLAWKPLSNFSVGASLDIAHQSLNAQGVIVPAPAPGGLAPLPSHGTQSANGAGLRVGMLWNLTPHLALGATFKSHTAMSRLSGYKDDLLASSDGHLDLPSQYGIGVAWTAGKWTLAADWLAINWGDISAMRDPNGFRWHNQKVVRFGVAWDCTPAWTLRAGFSHNNGLMDSDHTAQNLLVPSVNKDAYTLGATWHTTPHADITLGYELDPRTTLSGTSNSTGTNLTSRIQMFLLGYQMKF